ncbi:MAG: hypothetical protein OEQ12_07460 [Nitrosopumilus sp.]|nr:hypothetical protein [Nitrosopumilus sp.]
MNEKAVLRRSIIDLCKVDSTREESTDDAIRKVREKRGNDDKENLWDYVVALGAQLSRPPFDPYREKIRLKTEIGRKGTTKIILKIPILLYGEFNLSQSSQDALNLALNDLVDDNSTIGIISKGEPYDERKYSHFQIVNDVNKISDPEGIVMKYDDISIIERIKKARKEFCGPILVEVDEDFSEYTHRLLETGVDGILINTEKITKSVKYAEKHAISVIHDARETINAFYQGKENDGVSLIVTGDMDSTGKIVKSAGLGADVVGYNISLLIAKTGSYSEDFFDEIVTAKKIYNHMIATKNELTGIPAAIGYSNFHNLSPKDFRTSSLKASLEGEILLEGVNKTYREIVKEILDEYINTKKVTIDQQQKQKITEMILLEAN